MKAPLLAIALLAAAVAPAHAAITVHTSAFLGSVTNYNGFEGLPGGFPANTPYTEDGITVEYAGVAVISNASQIMEGNFSWYPNGGGFGYTKVTFGPTTAIQFAAGSGWFDPTNLGLQYEVLNANVVIATGTIAGISGFPGFGYYGFSGETFDEIHLQVQDNLGGFDGGAFEAGAYDAFSIGVVPEPSRWLLMLAGVGALGVALRRRQAAKA